MEDSEEFLKKVQQRRISRMAEIDALPPDIRILTHEYGYNVVKAMLDIGVSKPRHIKHLVETILNEFSPTRGASSSQGARAAPGSRDLVFEDE